MTRKRLTKSEAVDIFRQVHGEVLKSKDTGYISIEWTNFVDFQHRQGLVSDYQARIWVNPFLPKNKR